MLLDCCYSGAVQQGLRGDVGSELQIVEDARGFYIMTASTGLQSAREVEKMPGGAVMGRFTAAMVSGIESGAADFGRKGKILVSDLRRHLGKAITGQTPQFFDRRASGDPIISFSPSTAVQLPAGGMEGPTRFSSAARNIWRPTRGRLKSLEKPIVSAELLDKARGYRKWRLTAGDSVALELDLNPEKSARLSSDYLENDFSAHKDKFSIYVGGGLAARDTWFIGSEAAVRMGSEIVPFGDTQEISHHLAEYNLIVINQSRFTVRISGQQADLCIFVMNLGPKLQLARGGYYQSLTEHPLPLEEKEIGPPCQRDDRREGIDELKGDGDDQSWVVRLGTTGSSGNDEWLYSEPGPWPAHGSTEKV